MSQKLKDCVREIGYALNKEAIIVGIVVATLTSLGLLLIFDTSSADVLDSFSKSSQYYAVIKQSVFVMISLLCAYFVQRVSYKEWIEYSPLLFALTLFLLALTLLPGIGHGTNGARRWIGVGPLSFQASELLKIVSPLFYLYLFRSYQPEKGFQEFFKMLLLLITPLPLVFLQPDNGTVVIITSIIMSLLFLTKVRFLYWAVPILALSMVGGIFASQMRHVNDRIQIYLNPELDLLGKGHQPYQAKIAAGSGQLLGKGPGQSLQKLNYLPEANNDYIGAIFAEEYGFVGTLLLILLFIGLATVGFTVALKATDQEAAVLASVITFTITVQAGINLGIVSGMLPSTGTTLPFISAGGSSLLCNSLAAALLFNIANQPHPKESVL